MMDLLKTNRDEAFRQMLKGTVDTVLWSTPIVTDDGDAPFLMASDYEMTASEMTQLRYTVAHYLREWFEENADLALPFFEEFPDSTWDDMGKAWWIATQERMGALWEESENDTARELVEESVSGLYQLLGLYVDDDGKLHVDQFSVVPQTDELRVS